MKTHIGVAVMPVEPRRRTNVLVELLAGYVIIRDSNGKKLGSWRANEVSAKPDEKTGLLLKVATEEIPFETEDPAGFIKCLEAENRYFRDMAPSDRMKQAAPMGAVHFRKSPEEQESEGHFDLQEKPKSTEKSVSYEELSEETPTLDTASAEREEVVQQGPIRKIESDELVEKRSLHALLESVQAGVVESLQSGMRSWFGFYFVTGEGTGQERLETAIPGLREAADRLQELADRLRDADDLGYAEARFMQTYRKAVEEWAKALNMIADGVELDIQSAARNGLSLLVEASVTAKVVVRGPVYPNLVRARNRTKRVSLVGNALAYLSAVSPPGRVSKAAVRAAKQPWEQAIIAAGSPFRRL